MQTAPLEFLKQFKAAHSLLLKALEQELGVLPKFLFSQDIPANACKQEQILWRTICFSLTNFADNCGAIVDSTKERTWWIRRVIPVFQSFSNQSDGLITFEWCESEVESHALPTIDEDQIKETPWFADGVGTDWAQNERIVMEGSRPKKESLEKTIDDSVKQLHNIINMLKGIANNNL